MKPHIVPAILDHDEMARGKSQGARGRTVSLGVSPDGSQIVEPKSLVNQLDYFFKQFQFFGLDIDYIEQIFLQLLYYICAISLNNLMLRQELCMWKTGMKIRYNVSCLEEWARKKKMVNVKLKPLNATWLHKLFDILAERYFTTTSTVDSSVIVASVSQIRGRRWHNFRIMFQFNNRSSVKGNWKITERHLVDFHILIFFVFVI